MPEFVDHRWTDLAAIAASWLLVSRVIWTGFERLERLAAPKLRTVTTKWMLGLRERRRAGMSSFRGVWNAFFGSSAKRSSRYGMVVVLWLVGEAVGRSVISWFGGGDAFGPKSAVDLVVRSLSSIAFTCASVLKTDFLIHRFSTDATAARLLKVDFTLSVTFAAVCATAIFTKMEFELGLGPSMTGYAILLRTPAFYAGVMAGALMSTASVMLYMLTGAAVRFVRWTGKAISLFDVKRKPFEALGAMVIIVLTLLVFIPAAIVSWLK